LTVSEATEITVLDVLESLENISAAIALGFLPNQDTVNFVREVEHMIFGGEVELLLQVDVFWVEVGRQVDGELLGFLHHFLQTAQSSVRVRSLLIGVSETGIIVINVLQVFLEDFQELGLIVNHVLQSLHQLSLGHGLIAVGYS
jgi:hypothetical protein